MMEKKKKKKIVANKKYIIIIIGATFDLFIPLFPSSDCCPLSVRFLIGNLTEKGSGQDPKRIFWGEPPEANKTR
jgi:hypothetical protein